MTQTIENLMDELGVEEMTLARFETERARLVQKFYLKYGLASIFEIDAMIKSGSLCSDDLVEAWIDLHAMKPYIEKDTRPKRSRRAFTQQQEEGRESGPSCFRRFAAVWIRAELYSALRWTLTTRD